MDAAIRQMEQLPDGEPAEVVQLELPFEEKPWPHQWWTENLRDGHPAVVAVEAALEQVDLTIKIYAGKERGLYSREGDLPLSETATFFQSGLKVGKSLNELAKLLVSYRIPAKSDQAPIKLTGWRLRRIIKALDWPYVDFNSTQAFCGIESYATKR